MRYLAPLAMLFSLSASAHGLWVSDVMKGEETTFITAHVRDNEDANYLITVNGLSTGGDQFVFSNEVGDFPIQIENKDLIDNKAKVCALKESDSSMQTEVCVIVEAE